MKKKVRIKTWEELSGVGELVNNHTIYSPEDYIEPFVTLMERNLPDDRIIEMKDDMWGRWTIEDWMIDPTYPDAMPDIKDIEKFMDNNLNDGKTIYKISDGNAGFRDATEAEICVIESEYVVKEEPEENWQICTKENTKIGDEVREITSKYTQYGKAVVSMFLNNNPSYDIVVEYQHNNRQAPERMSYFEINTNRKEKNSARKNKNI